MHEDFSLTMLKYFCTSFALVFNFSIFTAISVNAQIVPDYSLGAESPTVIPNQIVKGVPSDLVSGGATRGVNLFHSFQNFNVGANQGVYFVAPPGVNNILTRVTGNSPSNIYGVLGVLGTANLFLLNSKGIFFGSNSQLDLNASFLATTATSIDFPNGYQFSTKNTQSPPLLTINNPI